MILKVENKNFDHIVSMLTEYVRVETDCIPCNIIYLGSWCHLSVKIFCSRCIVKTFRDETYIYMEAIYQISAQSDTWTITAQEGEVLAPFT